MRKSFLSHRKLLNLHSKLIEFMQMKKNLNRIKAVLADAGQTNKWLADQLGKDPVTISKWCTNTTQPDLQTLSMIAEVLGVNIRELLVDIKPTKQVEL